MGIFFSNSYSWEINETCLSSNMKPTFLGTNKFQLNLQMELPWGITLQIWMSEPTGNDLSVCHISNRIPSNGFVPVLKANFISCTFSEVLMLKNFSVLL